MVNGVHIIYMFYIMGGGVYAWYLLFFKYISLPAIPDIMKFINEEKKGSNECAIF